VRPPTSTLACDCVVFSGGTGFSSFFVLFASLSCAASASLPSSAANTGEPAASSSPNSNASINSLRMESSQTVSRRTAECGPPIPKSLRAAAPGDP